MKKISVALIALMLLCGVAWGQGGNQPSRLFLPFVNLSPTVYATAPTKEGTLRWNGATHALQVYNGSTWVSAGTGGSGDLVGPSGATDGNFPLYDTTTGKRLKDSAYGPSSFAPAYFTATADGNLATGDAVYISGTNLVKKADPRSAATMPVVGIVVTGVSSGQSVKVQTSGEMTISSWTAGQFVVVNRTTPGLLGATTTPGTYYSAGDTGQILGQAINTTTILIGNLPPTMSITDGNTYWTNMALVGATGGPVHKATPIDADFWLVGNSASANAWSYLTGTELKAYLKTYNDGLYFSSASALAIGSGGTGQTTAQAAIDALTAVSGATNEYVLTKDTSTGHAVFKASAGGGTTPDLWYLGVSGLY